MSPFLRPLLASTALIVSACAQNGSADLIVTNARVYTADGSGTFEEGLAIRGGEILSVGSETEILALRGPGTRVIDAGGGAVTPGLVDTHVHFLMGAQTLDQANVSGARAGEALTERVRAFAEAHPDRPWVLGFGYYADEATRYDLDRATGDRPAMIRRGDGHAMLVNSTAIELLGITPDTPDPEGGEIVRDENGEPTGHLLETAQTLLGPVLPPETLEERTRLLGLATEAALSAGVTTILNVGGTDDLELFDRARAEGELGVRVYSALWLTADSATAELPKSFAFTEEDADRFDSIRARYENDDMFRVGIVKIMLDGVIESHTAAVLAPYEDEPTTGVANYTPEELTAVIAMMDRRGWQIMTHALADRAVRIALDAYEAAAARNPEPPMGRRHKIEHIEQIDMADIPRFAALGVTASIQPDHGAGMNDPEMRGQRWRYLGYERSATGFPYRSIRDAGGRVAFGSDWPVASLNIGEALNVATHRLEHPPMPDQTLSVAEVIDAYTREAAWSIFADEKVGTLEPGKLADVVIFRDDIFAEDQPYAPLAVAYTILGGEVVYEAE